MDTIIITLKNSNKLQYNNVLEYNKMDKYLIIKQLSGSETILLDAISKIEVIKNNNKELVQING